MKIALFYNLPEREGRILIYEQVKRLKDKHRINLFTFIEDVKAPSQKSKS